MNGSARSTGRALVLHPIYGTNGGDRAPEERLAEALGLAQAIDLTVVAAATVRVGRPRPATFFGKGNVETYAEVVRANGIEVTVVDGPLTPVQQRNLERAWNCKVIDRTGLILEIFGARARTREGRLQVELAALSYQKSRLVRSWTHLERQRGGYGFLGGPGESQIETDRRLIGDRIARLKRELEGVRRTRELHRKSRRRVPYPVIALVGYTNAGKSTLFNRVTEASIGAKDRLFDTLDPTMRAITLPSGRRVILSDTVGFISDLPTHLVAAFRATLEEVCEADLIVHVRDIAHPESEDQKQDVHGVLRDLGLDAAVDEGLVEVLNKIDLLDRGARMTVFNRSGRRPDQIPVSAITGEGCDELLRVLDARLDGDRRVVDVSVDLADGATIAWLYDHGAVLSRHDDARHAHLRVGLDPADLGRFERRHTEERPA